MSSRQETDDFAEQPELTLKDRLNMPYLLAKQLMSIQKARLLEDLETRRAAVKECIEGLIHLIPFKWKDKKFLVEMKEALVILRKDIRPRFAGHPVSMEICRENKIKIFRETKSYDYNLMMQACMNLLDRKGMTSRRIYVEEAMGIPFEKLAEMAAEK